MHKLYELKETLCDELEGYANKGKLSAGDLEIVDKLSHTIKNLCKIIEKYEEDDYSGTYSMKRNRYSRENGRGGNYSNERGDSYAMARNRRSNGRYSNDNDMMVMELRELMEDAPDEKTRMEFEKFIKKIEMM